MASLRLIWPSGGTANTYSTDTTLTTPGNVSAADGTYTGAQAVSTGALGQRYGTWGWDANIPAGSTITDVQLEYKYKGTKIANNLIGHTFARISGTDQADHTDTESATFSGGTVIGPFSVFSDRSWTRADLLDGTFEMVIRATTSSGSWTGVGWDYIAVTVNWTPPSNLFNAPTFNFQTVQRAATH